MFKKLFEDEKTSEWNKLLDTYISLHKYIKDLGKKSISQARSGRVDAEVQTQLLGALRRADKALYQLKKFFKPCLTDLDVTEIFTEEQLRTEIQNLEDEKAKLEHDNSSLQVLNEQERQTFTEQKVSLQRKVFELEEHCQQFTEGEKGLPLSRKTLEISRNETLKSDWAPIREDSSQHFNKEDSSSTFKRKQQQLEETLKAQNYLIEELKQQLSDSSRDKDIFKTLNRNLEIELQKSKMITRHSSLSEENKYELQIINLQRELQRELQKNIQYENEIREAQCTIQTLQIALTAHKEELDKVRLENQILLELKTGMSSQWDDDEETSGRLGASIDQLKELLLDAHRERDFLKAQNEELHRELQQKQIKDPGLDNESKKVEDEGRYSIAEHQIADYQEQKTDQQNGRPKDTCTVSSNQRV